MPFLLSSTIGMAPACGQQYTVPLLRNLTLALMKKGVEGEQKEEGISPHYMKEKVAKPKVRNPQSLPPAAGRESKGVCDGHLMGLSPPAWAGGVSDQAR